MIELRQITKRFGDALAVDAVNLRINAGEFLTLLGPSGCGKTTILRLISGLETPDAGSIWLDGRDVTQLPPHQRDVNQVFQSYALFPHLNVQDNVAFGLRMKRVPRDERRRRVDEALEMVSLIDFEKRKPSQLSGGQKQRVALARAIVNRPKVLLLDEPLAALDAKLRRAVQIELKHLQKRLGITFVFVTHDQEEALVMSDRIVVMNGGKIEQLGPAAEIYQRPSSAFVAAFIGQANLLPASVTTRNQVVTQNGMWLAVEDQIAPVGSPLTLVIRPEAIQIVSREASENGSNVTEGKIVETIFRGELFHLRVRADCGEELLVSTTVAPQGARTRLMIDPRAIRALAP